MSDTHDAQEEVAEFYDDEATSYDERFESVAGEYIHQRQSSIILEQLGNVEGETILEIAAGTGRFTRTLVNQGADVVVADISREMLEQNQQHTPEADFIHGTASELPLKPSSIDSCITVNALNHIPGHWDVVTDVKRVLKPGGRFLANYPNLLSNRLPIGFYVNRHNRNVGDGVYTKWFNIFEVKSKLTEIGYTVEECTGDRLLPVKVASELMVPISKVTESVAETSPFSNFCVSPFILAQKE